MAARGKKPDEFTLMIVDAAKYNLFFLFLSFFSSHSSSPFFFPLPASRNSDPRSHSRLPSLSPPPRYGTRLPFDRETERVQRFLPSTARVEFRKQLDDVGLTKCSLPVAHPDG